MKNNLGLVPENINIKKGGYLIPSAFTYHNAFRWDFEFREKLLNKFREEDSNINDNCLRAFTAEMINLVDGKKSIREISEEISYQYNIRIKPETAIEFFLRLKEKNQIKLK